MQNPAHREVMAELYRVWERYENPPKVTYTDESIVWWDAVAREIAALYDKHASDPVARELIYGLYKGIENQYRAVNPAPTVERPQQLAFV